MSEPYGAHPDLVEAYLEALENGQAGIEQESYLYSAFKANFLEAVLDLFSDDEERMDRALEQLPDIIGMDTALQKHSHTGASSLPFQIVFPAPRSDT